MAKETTAKEITAGSEVDSYCTKCKIDLNHRVIAMDGVKPKRVECLTCRGHHNYRVPKAEREAAKKKKAAAKKKKAAAKKKKTTRKPRVTTATQLKQQWEEAITGRAVTDFTRYTIRHVFSDGELLSHKKFGDGFVTEVIEDGKVHVLFQDGLKTLVHGRE